MAECKHTPGPWFVEYGHDQKSGIRYWQIHDGLHAVCQNQFCWAAEREDVSEANARLIAAAPELLGAAETARAFARTIIGNNHPVLVQLDAAISKAEARTHD